MKTLDNSENPLTCKRNERFLQNQPFCLAVFIDATNKNPITGQIIFAKQDISFSNLNGVHENILTVYNAQLLDQEGNEGEIPFGAHVKLLIGETEIEVALRVQQTLLTFYGAQQVETQLLSHSEVMQAQADWEVNRTAEAAKMYYAGFDLTTIESQLEI